MIPNPRSVQLAIITGIWLASPAAFGKDQDLSSAIQLKVPPEWKGYSLRISGKPHQLAGKTLTYREGFSGKRRVELIDPGNRLIADHYTKIQPNTLSKLRERPLQMGVEVGFGAMTNDKLAKLRLHPTSHHAGVNAVYRPSAWGLMVHYSRHFQVQKGYSESTRGHYRMNRFGAGVVYEWAPLDRGPLFFERMHVGFMAGPIWNKHWAKIKEDDVSIEQRASSVGGQGAVELRIPLAVNLWLALRETYSMYDLKLNKLHFDETLEELTTSAGVRYAF